MRFPWGFLRVSSLLAVAVLAGYLWRDALSGEPDAVRRLLPPKSFSDRREPPVIVDARRGVQTACMMWQSSGRPDFASA